MSGHRGPGGPEREPGDFQLEQMEQETEEMLRVRYLNKENAEFERTGTGFLRLSAVGLYCKFSRCAVYIEKIILAMVLCS